jgi:hypothetical protein
MCARMEAQRVRKSVSTSAPPATNSATFQQLGESSILAMVNAIQVRCQAGVVRGAS